MIRRENKILKQNIQRLNIPDETIKNLENNKVITINDLCIKSKTNLKEIGLKQDEIEHIQIQLQLEGLNLRGSL